MRLSMANPRITNISCDMSFGEIMFTAKSGDVGIEAFFSVDERHFLLMVNAYNKMIQEAKANVTSTGDAGSSEEVSSGQSYCEGAAVTGADPLAGYNLEGRIGSERST